MKLVRTSLLIVALVLVGSEAPVIGAFSPFSIDVAVAGKFKPRHQRVKATKVKQPKPATVKPPIPLRVTTPKGPKADVPKKVGFERKVDRKAKPIVSKQDVRVGKQGVLKGHFDKNANRGVAKGHFKKAATPMRTGKSGSTTTSGNHNEASKKLTTKSQDNSMKQRRDEKKKKLTETFKIKPSPGLSGPGS